MMMITMMMKMMMISMRMTMITMMIMMMMMMTMTSLIDFSLFYSHKPMPKPSVPKQRFLLSKRN